MTGGPFSAAHKIPDLVDFGFLLALTTVFPGTKVTLATLLRIFQLHLPSQAFHLRAAWEGLSQVTIGQQLREGGSLAAAERIHGHSKGWGHQGTEGGLASNFKLKRREREVGRREREKRAR